MVIETNEKQGTYVVVIFKTNLTKDLYVSKGFGITDDFRKRLAIPKSVAEKFNIDSVKRMIARDFKVDFEKLKVELVHEYADLNTLTKEFIYNNIVTYRIPNEKMDTIEDLNEKIEKAKEDIDYATKSINNMKEAISDLEDNIYDYECDLKKYQKQLEEVKNND